MKIKKQNNNEKMSFEDSIEHLENIVSEMDSNSISIEDSMKYFEEGMNILNKCKIELGKAEAKVQELKKNKNDEIIIQDLN